ncbi:hypothetical protein KIPB_015812, partial [Kipferlia bialata]|eukprot:g15812.t1
MSAPPHKRRPVATDADRERETAAQMRDRHEREAKELCTAQREDKDRFLVEQARTRNALKKRHKEECTAAREAEREAEGGVCGECGEGVTKDFFVCAHCNQRVCNTHIT